MRTEWTRLSETEREASIVLKAFLNDRLASAETINWALRLGPIESVKRAAILQLIDSPEGRKLAEPWRSAWRLIEEYWDTPKPGRLADTRRHDIGRRVELGDRSGSLLMTIVETVAPRLKVSAVSHRPAKNQALPKKPRTTAEILSANLTSGMVVDPYKIRLDKLKDETFLSALANALGSVLIHALDTARRLGWAANVAFTSLANSTGSILCRLPSASRVNTSQTNSARELRRA